MRDTLGRFTHGHTSIPSRDTATGRFIKLPRSRYHKASSEVDTFLDGLTALHSKESKPGL